MLRVESLGLQWGESYACIKGDALHMAVGTQCGMGLGRDSLEAVTADMRECGRRGSISQGSHRHRKIYHATTCDCVCSHARGGAFAVYLSSGLICLVPQVLGAWSSYRLSFT